METLPEDRRERDDWNRETEMFHSGDHLANVALNLRMMSQNLPQQGSLARRCAIMANEVYKILSERP